eukprot:1891259-Alexandrium_andersonii.AAC.1
MCPNRPSCVQQQSIATSGAKRAPGTTLARGAFGTRQRTSHTHHDRNGRRARARASVAPRPRAARGLGPPV